MDRDPVPAASSLDHPSEDCLQGNAVEVARASLAIEFAEWTQGEAEVLDFVRRSGVVVAVVRLDVDPEGENELVHR
jgi:hypothetical protein